jgi:hypothetical protein
LKEKTEVKTNGLLHVEGLNPTIGDGAHPDSTDALENVNMDLTFNRLNINSNAADDNELQRTEFRTDGTVKIQEETLEMLEKRRESALIAWIAERHVQSVRVAPNQQFAFPKFEDFVEKNSIGEEVRVRWEHWLGHVSPSTSDPRVGLP